MQNNNKRCPEPTPPTRAVADKLGSDAADADVDEDEVASDGKVQGVRGFTGPDLVSRFLEASQQTGEVLSDDELIDIVLNFIIAGRDTTACALSWASLRLLRAPEVARELRREVRTNVASAAVLANATAVAAGVDPPFSLPELAPAPGSDG